MNARKTIVSANTNGFTFTKSEFAISDNDIGYFYSYSQSYQAKYQRAKRNGSLTAKAKLTQHAIEKGKAYLAFQKSCRTAALRLSIYHAKATKANLASFEAARSLQVACHKRYMSFNGLHNRAYVSHLLPSCVLDVGSHYRGTDRLGRRGALLRASRGY